MKLTPTFFAVLVLFLGCLLNKGVESRPNGAIESSENEARLKRNAQLPDLSGSTIVGGSHNFGTKTYTQTTQNNNNDGPNPHSSITTTTVSETPGLTNTGVFNAGENGPPFAQTISQQAPERFIKKCFYEKVPQNNIQIVQGSGYQVIKTNDGRTIVVQNGQNTGSQFITESDGTTISQSSQGQVIQTPSTTLYQGNFGKKKRSPQTFGYQGSTQIYNGGSKFQGGSHNFGTETFHQNQEGFSNFGNFGPLTTSTDIQEPGTYIEKCFYEKVPTFGQIPSTTIVRKNLGREKRSAQYFGYNNSQQNYGGSHYQGGSHNFGQVGNYGGSHFQGGQHNFGHQSYNQNRFGSTGRWY